MRTINQITLATFIFLFAAFTTTYSQDEQFPAYYKIQDYSTMQEAIDATRSALELNAFDIIGEYHPAKRDDLYVMTFTREDLAKITLKFKDRGALASVLKVGFVKKEGKVTLSMINPKYLFYAYLVDNIDPEEKALMSIADEVFDALGTLGNEFTPFGGALTKEELQKYHYKIMMPYFTDPEELQEFDSFEAGLNMIRKQLEAGKGNTKKVYEVVYPNEQVAVFGVGLFDGEEGEGYFLPIIGEDHICAMPYEMILQGKELTMLPGRYRIALHWPELTMGTFMKIMSTPGDIEDFLEALSEE